MDGGRLFLHRFQADSGRPARAKHCTMGRKDAGKAPSYGYCAWHKKRWQCPPKASSAPQSASFHPNRSIQPHRSKPANAGLGAFLFLLVSFLSLLPLTKEKEKDFSLSLPSGEDSLVSAELKKKTLGSALDFRYLCKFSARPDIQTGAKAVC